METRIQKSAEDALVREHMGMVHVFCQKWARALARYGMDYDDLVQIGSIALLRAIRQHDPNKGELSALVYRALRGVFQHAFVGAQRDKRGSLEALIGARPDDHTALYVEDFMKQLHPRERRILAARMEGQTLQAISETEGISRERVRQLLTVKIAESYKRSN